MDTEEDNLRKKDNETKLLNKELNRWMTIGGVIMFIIYAILISSIFLHNKVFI